MFTRNTLGVFRALLIVICFSTWSIDLNAKPFRQLQGVCVGNNRAIVLYQGKLFAMGEGTCVLTQYMHQKRYEAIIGNLPTEVMIITDLSARELYQKPPAEPQEIVEYWHWENKKEVAWYMVADQEGRLNLIKELPEETSGLLWNPNISSGEHIKDSHHIFDITISSKAEPSRMIRISKEPLVMKNEAQKEIRMYPLTLTNDGEMAIFHTIEFSGK